MKRGKMRALSIIMSAALVLGTLPSTVTMAAAEDPEQDEMDETQYGIQMLDGKKVPYVDETGAENTATATELTNSDTTWNEGFYVADSNITISGRITVNGDVKLILADGYTLTANEGITVAEGYSLTIYGQENETGILTASSVNSSHDAAIGGYFKSVDFPVPEDEYVDAGTITICGGTVNAASGQYGAAIGGGHDANGGVINITGGTVTAKSGGDGAAIGTGEYINSNTISEDEAPDYVINITGGTVTAESDGHGAAIGGGSNSTYGSINIENATVTALSGGDGAGIGDGTVGTSIEPKTKVSTRDSFIVASGITDDGATSFISGAIIIDGEGRVYGDTTLTTDAEIPAGDSLLIPEGTSLTIDSDTTLTNCGTVYQNWGSTFNKNSAEAGSYSFAADEGKTYYQIVNDIDMEGASLQGDTTTYPGSSWIYSQADNPITISLLDGSLKQFNLTKNSEEDPEIVEGSYFVMPDEPVTISDGVAAMITVPIPEPDETKFTYNGTEQTYTLEESDYYTIVGNRQTNAGTYTVTVSLNDPTTSMWEDNTTEDKPYLFTILPAEFDVGEVEAYGYSGTYDGSEHSIHVALSGAAENAAVTYSTTGEEGTYTDENPSYTDAGTYTVYYKVSKDNYEDATGSAAVNIAKAVYDMSGVTFSDKTYTYDGKEHAIKIEIEDGGTLPGNVKVSYTNNTGTAVGTYDATAHFTGDEKNHEPIADMTATLTIVDAGFDDMTITAAGYNGIYDGQAHSVTVTISGDTEGTEVTYSTREGGLYTNDAPSFTDVGAYTVYYKVSKANYKDVTGSLTVNIAASEILETQFSVDTEPEAYTGSEITKEIVSEELAEGTDYTVSYADNTNAGEAVITIKGIGNYTGELTYAFTIEEASFTEGSVTSTGYNGTYDGNAYSITVELSGDAESATVTYSTEANGEYTEDNPSFTDVGTYTVYYKVSRESYFDVTGSETVVINGIDIAKESTVSLTSTNMTYNGSRQTAGIVVTAADDTVLTEGVDYVLEGQKAKAAGTHKATVTGIGHYTGTVTVKYKIAKAPQELTAVVKKDGSLEYSVKASKLKEDSRTFKIKVTKKGKMRVRYTTNSNKIKVNKNGKVTLKKGLKAGTYKIKVTTGSSKNYKANTTPVKITVKVK